MSDENFLARWSQRKRQVAQEALKAPEPEAAPEDADEPFDLSLLPDIEALTPETDISLFLKKGVPDSLRNAALRRMWALDPAIRDYVGDALDYAWDWNAPGGVPGGGELGEGFDAAGMVARIFGDEPADKKVIEDVAVQQDGPETPVAKAETADESSAESGSHAENPADPRMSVQVKVESAQVKSDAALHNPRRHGGAAPILSAKSLVS